MTGIETLVASAVASQVARKISDFAKEEITLCCNFDGDLEHTKKTLSDMQPRLKQAEDNSFGSDRESVREWLRLMKTVAYDIEDILDEYYYHNPDEQFDEICCVACSGKVPLLCSLSMSNPMLTRICMIHKMKTERQRLQKELVAPSAYGLYEIINSPGNSFEEKETTSQANGTAIIGRDKDMENIMSMVRVKEYLIISIHGAVGLGKTSLAQLIYNHNETSKIFRTQKMWIHVPKGKANLKYIGTHMISRDGGKIYESMTEEDIMNGVSAMLNKYDSYLIVLDGLWSASEKALQDLKVMLTTGSNRNVKVIVTTHSEKVAALMSTTKLSYKLNTLSEASILTIFSQRAMASNDEMEIITRHPLFWNMLKKYGKKIIERCEGTPLVANFLGSVVSSGRLSRQWGDYWAPASIEEMWKVEEDFDNNRCNISLLLPSLKPIYYNMHNELRLCFVYLSIFPKGSSIDKKKLIQQWIALNMIEPSKHGNLRREETAEDYIDQLKAMYFLQTTAQHSPVNEEVVHVHNLAYELARSVGSKDILVISDAISKKEAKKSSFNHDYRYAQLSTPVPLSVDPKDCIRKARSLILRTLESEGVFVSQVISENKYLRVLDLRGCSISELPGCIFKLKHLRYLDASGLPITVLPPELGNLVKLETLDVSGTNLTLVPSCISSLKVLNYLNLKGCQNLQQLHSLDELHELSYLNLSGCLSIINLPKSLLKLKNLCFLNLSEVRTVPDELLQSLYSLESLEGLMLSGLEVKSLPDIFGPFLSLQFLNLSQCSTLQQLPQSFFKLQSLKGLDLSFCSGIEEITESFGRLYSLTFLNLSGCTSLRILPTSFGDLVHLEELNLSYCTALAELPISFRSLERLHVLKLHRCVHLIEQVNHLTNSLEHIELTSCKDINLQSNFFSYLTRLRVLDLSNCSQMEIVVGTPANLEVLILANVALPLDLNFLTQFQNLQKLDITDAILSTASAALSNLQSVFTFMPMLKSVETNNLDVYSILPSRIKISRVMDSLTGVESSNVRDRENTDGRNTPSVVEEGPPNTSAERSDLIRHSSSSGEEVTEDTSADAANRDLASSTNSDATKVDALEDYAQQNINGEQKLQDCEHQAGSTNCSSSSSTSSGPILSASSSVTSTHDLNCKTEVMAEEASRANWNFLYEKGLIEVLTEHKVDARFKGQNGWNSDGWRSITCKFNEKFPSAHFTKQQLQDKEKDLKASYKAISNAKNESGVGWNETMGMISAEPDLWEKCARKFPKLKKHRKNGFPLFRSCEVLYEGSIARGDMSFTSTDPVLHVASVDEPVQHVPRAGSEINVAGPSVGSETNVVGLMLDQEACEVQSPPSGTSVHGSGKKRKKSQVASVLDDYLEHKKNQTDKTMEAFLEKKSRGEESMDRCVHIFEAMEELTDEEKAIAAEVFENELNREMFLKLTIHNVRLIWLRRKISRITST